MSLAAAVQFSVRPAQRITWTDGAGTALDITGATMTGYIQPSSGAARAITGALTVIDGAAGIFEWQYSAADVAEAGKFEVTFVATFPSGPTPGRTRRTAFEVFSSPA